jgi:hypothetical protein
MSNLIDKNTHHPAAGQQPTTTQPKEAKPARPQVPAKSAPEVAKESFSTQRAPSQFAPKSTGPMAGAFVTQGTQAARAPAPAKTTNALTEHQEVLDAASNVMAKTEGKTRLARLSAGMATVGAVGLSIAMPPLAIPAVLGALTVGPSAGLLARRSNQQTVKRDAGLQKDVDTLKSARDRLKGRGDLSQMETDTLAMAEKALKI